MTERQALDGLPACKRPALPALAVVGVLEAVSPTVLLVNLAVGNNQQLAQNRCPTCVDRDARPTRLHQHQAHGRLGFGVTPAT